MILFGPTFGDASMLLKHGREKYGRGMISKSCSHRHTCLSESSSGATGGGPKVGSAASRLHMYPRVSL